MTDLIEFLRGRIAEDEREAKRVEPNQAPVQLRVMVTREGSPPFLVIDSARVLADVDAKRRIIEAAEEANGIDMQLDGEFRVGSRDRATEPYIGDLILRALALPYIDHPDYREEWRP